MAMHLSTRRWQDQLMVLIGVWLFISPWVFLYPPGTPAAWNATLAGAIIGILAAFDLVRTYVWAVLFNIVVGAWVTISPWLVDTVNDPAMTWSLVIAGSRPSCWDCGNCAAIRSCTGSGPIRGLRGDVGRWHNAAHSRTAGDS